MSWQHALELLGIASISFCILVCVIGARIARRRDRERILGRLNSPFFRQVTDPYYRAGKLQ
jgi:hypothetical protein